MKAKILTSVAGKNFAYSRGQIVDAEADRITGLVKAGHAKLINKLIETATKEPEEKAVEIEPKHIGGGWYELPDGSRIQGRDAAIEAMDGDQ